MKTVCKFIILAIASIISMPLIADSSTTTKTLVGSTVGPAAAVGVGTGAAVAAKKAAMAKEKALQAAQEEQAHEETNNILADSKKPSSNDDIDGDDPYGGIDSGGYEGSDPEELISKAIDNINPAKMTLTDYVKDVEAAKSLAQGEEPNKVSLNEDDIAEIKKLYIAEGGGSQLGQPEPGYDKQVSGPEAYHDEVPALEKSKLSGGGSGNKKVSFAEKTQEHTIDQDSPPSSDTSPNNALAKLEKQYSESLNDTDNALKSTIKINPFANIKKGASDSPQADDSPSDNDNGLDDLDDIGTL